MKSILQFIGFVFILSNCSQPKSDETLISKTYYPEEKVTCISEMTQDSVLHGKTSWSDSTNNVYLEEIYTHGKLKRQISKVYENGKLSVVVEHLKDKEFSRKEYLPNGDLRFQCPFDITNVGKLQYKINDGKRDYLIRTQEDTIEFFAKNLPSSNQVISAYGGTLSKKGKGWIVKSSSKSKVRIYMECTSDCKRLNRVFLDSIIIPVKSR